MSLCQDGGRRHQNLAGYLTTHSNQENQSLSAPCFITMLNVGRGALCFKTLYKTQSINTPRSIKMNLQASMIAPYWYYGYLQSVNKRDTILSMMHLGLDINSSHNLGRQYKIIKTDQNVDQLAIFKLKNVD